MGSVSSWDILASASTFVLLIVTAVYAYLTHRIARATEDNLWQVNRAIVSARLNVSQRALLGVVFENLGKSPASDLTIQIDRPVFQMLSGERDIAEVPMINNGLKTFPPNFPVEIYLGTTFQWLNENTPREKHPANFDLMISYQTGGRNVTETMTIDIVNQLQFMGAQADSADEFFRNFPEKYTKSMDKLVKKIEVLAQQAPPPIVRGRSWSDWFHKSQTRLRHLRRWG